MIKVVLVDDEDVIIEGLKIMIPWESLGMEVAGEAYDGEEALEVMERIKPDIVITDIRMPVLNGLDMIDRVKGLLPLAAVVILSGYSDFDYAQQAIEKGANCYLLKPVGKEELIQKLLAIKEQLLKRKKSLEEGQKASISLYSMRGAAKDKYLCSLVNKDYLPLSDIESIWNLFEFGQVPARICVAVFEIDDFNARGFTNQNDKFVLKYAVDNVLEELTMKADMGIVFSYNDEKSVLIACEKNSDNLKKELYDTVNEMKETALMLWGITLSVGIGGVYRGANQLPKSFREAQQALEMKFIHGKNHTFDIDMLEASNTRNEYRPAVQNALMEDLVLQVEAAEAQKAALTLERLFVCMIHELHLSQKQVYAECQYILILLRQRILESVGEGSAALRERTYQVEYMESLKTYKELQNWMQKMIHEWIESIKNRPVTHQEQLVDRIKKYVNQQFADATRSMVAEHFHLNPSYLSQVFKNVTGQGFTDYLTEVRMEEARRLLLNTDLKIQIIAEKVGYNSSQHFSKVFEKNTGKMPFDFRKKQSRSQ
ncbi:MAG: response regulator [Paenibacillaceae bacterium]|jgi:YesN/AraC family two-component response regulator|nr:response regulator [Paenibacillaceae bacterium]